MPAIVKKQGEKYVVKSHQGSGGKTLGTHGTRTAAQKQQAAVNAALKRKGKI